MAECRPMAASKNTFTEHNAVNLTLDDEDYAGVEINCENYDKFLLMYDITETGVLVDNDRLRLRIQFRESGGTWRDYVRGPFGALYEEESTTPCNKCIGGEALGERMRVVATTDYTNADPTTNYFTLTSKVTLVR
jgi:hypothetical protein